MPAPVPRITTVPKFNSRPKTLWDTSTLSILFIFISIVRRETKPVFRTARRSVITISVVYCRTVASMSKMTPTNMPNTTTRDPKLVSSPDAKLKVR